MNVKLLKINMLIFILLFVNVLTLFGQTLKEKREGSLVGLQDSIGNIVVPVIYDQILDPYAEAIAVQKGSKWGMLSRNNKIIQPVDYKSLMYGDGYFIVQKENNVGLINRFGEDVIPVQYYYVEIYSSKSKYFIVTDLNKKMGVIDIDNKQIIDFKYDRLEFLTDTTFVVEDSVSSKYGVIDLNENLLLPYEFTSIKKGIDPDNYIVTKKLFDYGVIDKNQNEILPIEYSDIKVFEEEYYLIESQNRQGIADHTGKMIIPQEYERIFRLRGNLFTVTKDGTYYGYVDSNNKYIIQPQYTRFGFTSQKLWILENVDTNKWNLYNPSTKKILPESYDSYDFSFDTDLVILQKDSLFGIVDLYLKPVLPFEYSNLEIGEGENIIARKNGKWGFIDSTGKILTPFRYTGMIDLSDETRAFEENNKWSVFDLTGKKLSKENYDEVIRIKIDSQDNYLPQYMLVRNDNKYGVIDRYGDVIRNVEYDSIQVSPMLDFMFKKNGRWSVSSMSLYQKGQLYDVLPCVYDRIIFNRYDNTYIVKKDGKWGKYDLNSKDMDIIPIRYDSFEVYEYNPPYMGTFNIVSLNNKYGIIDNDKQLLDCIYDEIDLTDCRYRNDHILPRNITLRVRKGNEWSQVDFDLDSN